MKPGHYQTLVVSLRNMRAGSMVQTQEPMVLPTNPSTSSMSGTRIPMMRQIKITPPVIMLNLNRIGYNVLFSKEPGGWDVVIDQLR